MTPPAALAVPLQPDGDEARRLLVDELAKGPYQAARPSLLDLAAQAFLDWFQSLFSARGSAAPPVLLVLALVAVVAVVVVALVLFGLPRVNRRGAGAAAALFGDDDRRTAAELRRAADDAARAGDWSLAVLERFRALARGLDERTLVPVLPGTTATGFSRAAAVPFPDLRPRLAEAAGLFDRVRYASVAAVRAEAEALAALEADVAAARPALPAAAGA